MIPALCEVTVDCRLLPGQTQAEAEEVVRERARRGRLRARVARGRRAGRARRWKAALGRDRGWVAEHRARSAALAPICVAGFTDSHWLREAFGTVAYGFFPLRYMDAQLATRLVHSADERIRVDDLELGVEFLRYAARDGR